MFSIQGRIEHQVTVKNENRDVLATRFSVVTLQTPVLERKRICISFGGGREKESQTAAR